MCPNAPIMTSRRPRDGSKDISWIQEGTNQTWWPSCDLTAIQRLPEVPMPTFIKEFFSGRVVRFPPPEPLPAVACSCDWGAALVLGTTYGSSTLAAVSAGRM